ncbi:MAG: transcription antitermination factor NusB [Planctomycetota bacterium]
MSRRRDTRRLAMQVLYQIDATGEADAEVIFAGLDETHDPPEVRRNAVTLAVEAWTSRGDYDARIAALAPDWPTHRQPPVDRAVLRLAAHEIATGRTPAKIAINEAVELAKAYSNENAPAFINGVLDKLRRQLEPAEPPDQPPATPEAWLDDAKGV